jgi:hypothetical protein
MIRGLFTFGGVLHAVRDTQLLRFDDGGTVESLGLLNSAAGPVDMAQNLTQLVITDGDFLYVWDGATLSQTANWTAGPRIAFVDQRIVGIQNGSQRFQWTALGDAKVANALDFYSAEGSPDTLVSVLSSQRELLLLGSETAEVWYSVGGDAVFERAQSEFIQHGCAAAFSAQLVGGVPMWLGRDRNGQARVLAGRGERVSTRAIEERFDGLDLSQAQAYTYSDGGQHFYCLNCPGVETTLCFDRTFSQWHERAELVSGDYQPWRPTCHAFAYGAHFFGTEDGKIFRLDPNAHDYAGNPKCRQRTAPVISDPSRKRLRFPSVELVCEKGTAANVMLRWSDDNGNTWSGWQTTNNGLIGQYNIPLQWRRLGSAFDRVYEVRVTDPQPFNPVGAQMRIE